MVFEVLENRSYTNRSVVLYAGPKLHRPVCCAADRSSHKRLRGVLKFEVRTFITMTQTGLQIHRPVCCKMTSLLELRFGAQPVWGRNPMLELPRRNPRPVSVIRFLDRSRTIWIQTGLACVSSTRPV